jgi:hypothetical protein
MTFQCPHPDRSAGSATVAAAASSGIGAVDRSGAVAGRSADPLAYRRLFRDRWGTFLRAHFHNHLHVAVFFGVDEKTARMWWHDVNEPRGWAVAYARDTIPGAAQALAVAA